MKVRIRAFTLIELLVVVAIIALLISILLPSLKEAREQGKKAACLSNLKQMGNCQGQYQNEFNDTFPHHWAKGGANTNGVNYGGKWVGGDNFWYCRTGYGTDGTGPEKKPFNVYMYPNFYGKMKKADETKPELAVMELPVYKCPSDFGAQFNNDPNGQPTAELMYDTTGTSYDQNYHASLAIQTSFAGQGAGGNPDPPRVFWDMAPTTGWLAPETPPNTENKLMSTNAFWKKKLITEASRFLTLWEDTADVALFSGIQTRGYHKKWSTHSVLFLDGHADNLYMDTRQTWGKGFNSASQYWREWGEYGER